MSNQHAKLVELLDAIAGVNKVVDSLTVAQLGVLAAVALGSGKVMNEIWKNVPGISYSACSHVTSKLIGLGLIDWAENDGDRRYKKLFIAPRGQQVLKHFTG